MKDLREASPWANRHALSILLASISAHSVASVLTIDSLLGASEVNGLNATGLLELGGDGSLWGSCAGSSVDG